MARILVGGDNETTLNVHYVLREAFQDASSEVLYCSTPDELLTRLEAAPKTDLVFLHYDTAELTNLEIYYQLRALRGPRQTTVMQLASEVLEDEAARTAEGIAVVDVPVTKLNLFRRINDVLRTDIRLRRDEDRVLTPPPKRDEPEESEEERKAREMRSRRREMYRSKMIQFRSGEAGEDEAVDSPESVGGGEDEFYIIPDHWRRKWFYTSDLAQSFFDIVEDSRFYQNRCRRKYERANRSATAPPVAADKPAKDSPSEEGAFTVTEVRRASASTRARAARAGYAERSASRKRLKVLLLVLPLLAVAVGAVGVKVILSRTAVDPSTYARISCTKCEGADELFVPNIHEARCPKCGSAAGFTFECRDCSTVFPVIPDRSVRTVVDIVDFPKCPKCEGTKTRPLKTNPPPEK